MPLTAIAGQRIGNFNWKPELETVLEYYDGPRLTLYREPSGAEYLAVWNDSQDGTERWLFIQTEGTGSGRYSREKSPLREALENPQTGFILVVDQDGNGHASAVITTADNLPQDSLPYRDVTLNIPAPQGWE